MSIAIRAHSDGIVRFCRRRDEWNELDPSRDRAVDVMSVQIHPVLASSELNKNLSISMDFVLVFRLTRSQSCPLLVLSPISPLTALSRFCIDHRLSVETILHVQVRKPMAIVNGVSVSDKPSHLETNFQLLSLTCVYLRLKVVINM